MSAASNDQFFASVPVFAEFKGVADTGNYRPLPEGWILALADIVGSTKAIGDGRYKDVNMISFAVVAFLATGVPLLAILATALARTISGGLALDNVSLDNFIAVFSNSAGAVTALINSFSLGIGTAVITGLVGVTAAYTVVKTKMRGRTAIDIM